MNLQTTENYLIENQERLASMGIPTRHVITDNFQKRPITAGSFDVTATVNQANVNSLAAAMLRRVHAANELFLVRGNATPVVTNMLTDPFPNAEDVYCQYATDGGGGVLIQTATGAANYWTALYPTAASFEPFNGLGTALKCLPTTQPSFSAVIGTAASIATARFMIGFVDANLPADGAGFTGNNPESHFTDGAFAAFATAGVGASGATVASTTKWRAGAETSLAAQTTTALDQVIGDLNDVVAPTVAVSTNYHVGVDIIKTLDASGTLRYRPSVFVRSMANPRTKFSKLLEINMNPAATLYPVILVQTLASANLGLNVRRAILTRTFN